MICTKGFDEATALRAGYAYEQATAWHRQTPDLSWASARTSPKHMPSLAPPGRKGGSLMEFLVAKDPGSQEERLGFVPVSNGALLTTNVAFGGPDNPYMGLEAATSETFWRLQAPSPGRAGRRTSPGAARSRWTGWG